MLSSMIKKNLKMLAFETTNDIQSEQQIKKQIFQKQINQRKLSQVHNFISQINRQHLKYLMNSIYQIQQNRLSQVYKKQVIKVMLGEGVVSQKQIIEKLVDIGKEFLKKYEKTSDFFLIRDRYVSFFDEVKEKGLDKNAIEEVFLECSGQGSFRKNEVASRFLATLRDVISFSFKIKKVKLKISGFDLTQKLQSSERMSLGAFTITQQIQNLLRDRMDMIESLEIRITQVTNCSLNDLKRIMQLGMNPKAAVLNNLSYEFSDWTFLPNKSQQSLAFDNKYIIDKKLEKGLPKIQRNGQPTIHQFYKSFDESGELIYPLQKIERFRLEISTWYYTDYEFEKFFEGLKLSQDVSKHLGQSQKLPTRIRHFHKQFKTRMQGLISLMPNLKHMEIDLRNWSKKFQMSELKKQLTNISKDGRRSANSQISRRVAQKQTMSYMLKLSSQINPRLSKAAQTQNQEQKKSPTFDLIVVV